MERKIDSKFRIIPYNKKYQPEIDELLKSIDLEFEQSIFSGIPSPIPAAAFWLALFEERVIGTVVVLLIKNEFAILKKMMLHKSFRGKDLGIAKRLLETAIHWTSEQNIPGIYLGTMEQFKAAQSFYTKNQFQSITKEQLPKGFIDNPLDSLYFYRQL